MSNPQTFDTIVIGAGIIGSGCAYKIAKKWTKNVAFRTIFSWPRPRFLSWSFPNNSLYSWRTPYPSICFGCF
uniref:Uncharacterized protein n=1 Tax=Meloidogyne enterolobii TaxID=390850 RepID=A0A6V7U551_MELEN|nr:unnamed protein product [Meloidogyne enterolobii]